MKCLGSSPKRHDTFFVDVLNYEDLEGGLKSDRPPHCELDGRHLSLVI